MPHRPIRVAVLNDHVVGLDDRSDGMVDSLHVLVTEPLEVTGWAVWSMCWVSVYTMQTDRSWGPWVTAWWNIWRPQVVLTPRLAWGDPAVDESWACVHRWCCVHGIPIVALWTDLVTQADIRVAEQLSSHVTYHLSIDRSTPPPNAADPSQYVCLWTPQNPRRFYHHHGPRPIVASFIGERVGRPERESLLSMIQRAGVPLVMTGGRREADERLSMRAYAQVMRDSQMALDITSHPTDPHIKGRTFEALACGTLLVGEETPALQRYLAAGQEYVAYRAPTDAVEALRYYMAHPSEAREIAERGHRTYRRRFTPAHFWDQVFTALWGSTWMRLHR